MSPEREISMFLASMPGISAFTTMLSLVSDTSRAGAHSPRKGSRVASLKNRFQILSISSRIAVSSLNGLHGVSSNAIIITSHSNLRVSPFPIRPVLPKELLKRRLESPPPANQPPFQGLWFGGRPFGSWQRNIFHRGLIFYRLRIKAHELIQLSRNPFDHVEA
jgi:hypothetical protein